MSANNENIRGDRQTDSLRSHPPQSAAAPRAPAIAAINNTRMANRQTYDNAWIEPTATQSMPDLPSNGRCPMGPRPPPHRSSISYPSPPPSSYHLGPRSRSSFQYDSPYRRASLSTSPSRQAHGGYNGGCAGLANSRPCSHSGSASLDTVEEETLGEPSMPRSSQQSFSVKNYTDESKYQTLLTGEAVEDGASGRVNGSRAQSQNGIQRCRWRRLLHRFDPNSASNSDS
jgi:hypothetical protein